MRCQVDLERDFAEPYKPNSATSDQDIDLQPSLDEMFKRHFCVAAQDLADELRQPLEGLGVIYDDVLATTGPGSRSAGAMGYSRLYARKGQVMFTVRQLRKQDASRLAAAGFRFTTIENVTKVLSRRIHIPASILGAHLKDMRDFAATSRSFEPGIHLVSYLMRPTVQGHFEVLTAKGTGNPLPSSTLSARRLHPRNLELIARMEGWGISGCLGWLNSDAARAYGDVDGFRADLIQAITRLSQSLPPDVVDASGFSPHPLVTPCRADPTALPTDDGGATCILLAFCALGSLDTRVSNPDYAFTPLKLFRVQQAATSNSSNNHGEVGTDGFAKELNQDLYYSNVGSNPSSSSGYPEPGTSSLRSALRFWQNRRPSAMQGQALPAPGLDSVAPSVEDFKSPFSGIMVRQEVKVDIANLTIESAAVGNSLQTSIVAGDVDSHSYVDELSNRCYALKLQPCPLESKEVGNAT